MPPTDVDHALSEPPQRLAEALSTIPEDQWFERKSGRIRPSELAVPLVAFANAEGGTLVVGLSDGAVDGVSDARANDLRQAAVDCTRPPVRTHIRDIATPEGRLLVIRVAPGEHVHETQKGDCYQRIGDGSRRLSFAQRQELQWDRGVARFSGTPVPGLRIEDLDHAQLASYQQLLGSSTVAHALRARELLTHHDEVTVAACLLFSLRPQTHFPSAHVRVLKYAGTDLGAGRGQTLEQGGDVRCEGSVPAQLEQAVAAIERLMPRRRALAASGRFEDVPMIPTDAWLEGLVNAVVHRSYSIGGDHVRVELFPDRIEITSPGRFPGTADPTDPESISRNARNPRIARVCADLGITQELGEGIRRIFAEMRRVGLSEPMYLQAPEAVRLTLTASDAIPASVIAGIHPTGHRILDTLRRAQRPLGTGQVTELTGLARPTVLRHLNLLRDAGLVTWQGNSPRDPRATWHLA